MKGKQDVFIRISLVLMIAVFWIMAPLSVCAETEIGSITVEYGNLEELLKNGNIKLKQDFEEYEDKLEEYQEMWDLMKWQESIMKDNAEDAEGTENADIYSSNAENLKSTANRIYQQLDKLSDEKSTRSLQNSADSYTMSAQTIMNSYNQMVESVEVQEKKVEVSQAVYAETVKRQAIGSATQAEVLTAQKNLSQASNSLESFKEQAAQLKGSFLTMLGLQGMENVVIGEIPEPELAAIDAIDIESDKEKAVGNSSNVQSARHATAKSTADINRRFDQVEEAEGKAAADIQENYDNLMAKKVKYQASLEAYQSAILDYQSLLRKNQAGLLSNTEYLQGIADFQGKQSAKEIASMNLMQAYESYCWEVEGITK